MIELHLNIAKFIYLSNCFPFCFHWFPTVLVNFKPASNSITTACDTDIDLTVLHQQLMTALLQKGILTYLLIKKENKFLKKKVGTKLRL